jgi:hypothetical protein
MMNVATKTGVGVAVSAAAMSVVWGLFVPYAYPWPSLVWALLACAAAVWVAAGANRPDRSMSDVIGDVDAEAAQSTAPKRGAVSTRVVL